MKILSSKTHGVLDYLTVIFLLFSPSLFNMSAPANQFTYTLAFIHLALTLLTRFELGVIRIVPLWLHGIIELSVSILLLIATLILNVWTDKTSYYFYILFSAVLFLVWYVTDYNWSLQKES